MHDMHNLPEADPQQDAEQPSGEKQHKQHTVTAARNEIGPLLDELILQLDVEGSATHKAHFARIRGHLYGASDDWELTAPIIELSSCQAMGFRFSQTADALIHRILQKTATLVRVVWWHCGVDPHVDQHAAASAGVAASCHPRSAG